MLNNHFGIAGSDSRLCELCLKPARWGASNSQCETLVSCQDPDCPNHLAFRSLKSWNDLNQAIQFAKEYARNTGYLRGLDDAHKWAPRCAEDVPEPGSAAGLVINPDQLAKILGVSYDTVMAWIADTDIPVTELPPSKGHLPTFRFLWPAVLGWLQARARRIKAPNPSH